MIIFLMNICIKRVWGSEACASRPAYRFDSICLFATILGQNTISIYEILPMGFTTPIAKWTLDLSELIENLFIANTLGSTLTIFHSVYREF